MVLISLGFFLRKRAGEKEMVLKRNILGTAVEKENPPNYTLVLFFEVMVAAMMFR